MILDTDILVWVLRRHPGAIQFVEGVRLAERTVSAVSYLELLYGCRDQGQLDQLRRHISTRFAEVVPLSEDITVSAQRLIERFVLSRRPDVADVLIAATALSRGETLATGNPKHFDFVPGLEIRVFRS